MKTTTTLTQKWIAVCVAAITLMTVGSCGKDKLEETANQTFPVPSYPTPSDADAVLVAVKASTPYSLPTQLPGMPVSEINMEYGLGVALFKDKARADRVVLNGTELKYTNGVHIWQPDFSNLMNPSSITGIDLSGAISWNVTNPNIDKNLSGLPTSPRINSGKVVTKSAGYTIAIGSTSGAQRILYGIYSSNGKYVLKEDVGTSRSMTFTATELAELGTTNNGIIQANAYTIVNENIAGKKVYFVRQSSYSVTGVEIK